MLALTVFHFYPDILAKLVDPNKPLHSPCHPEVGLISNGWCSEPRVRRIVDVEHCFYAMTRRLKCGHSSCNTTYSGFDSKITSQIPLIMSRFSIIFSHRSSISKSLLDMMVPCFNASMGTDPFQKKWLESFIENIIGSWNCNFY